MRIRATGLFSFAIIAAALAYASAAEVEVFFSPNGGAAGAISKEVEKATMTVHVMAYAISEAQITQALIAAKNRGVAVRLIVDRHEQGGAGSTAGKIKKAGVPTTVDRCHALMHNKTMVIDGSIVITGSMNFTTSGERKNSENTLIIRDAELAKRYELDFANHLEHSSTFVTPPVLSEKEESTPSPALQKVGYALEKE